MKHLLFVAILALGAAVAQAQITYVFTGATATGAPANITAGSVTQVNNNGTTTFLAAGTPASTGYTGASGGNNGNFSAKIGSLNTSTSTYLQAVITPATGYWVNLTAIEWGNFSLSTTGPTTLSVYTSINNYASPLATATVTHSGTTWSLLNPTFAPISGFTSTAVTIRIYASGGTGTTPAAGAANWRVDDLKITATASSGTVGQLPKYSNLTSFTNSIIYESPAGNIGVGTATPTQKLDVNGNLRVSSQISNSINTNKIHFQYDVNNGIGFQLTDGNAIQMAAVAGNNYLQAIGGTAPFHIGTWPAKPIKFEVGSTKAMMVHANGKISIASETDNGLGQLQITGNTWTSGYAQFANPAFGAPNVKVGFDGTNTEAIAITGAGVGTPVIKMPNIVYAIDNGKGVIDITADHTYMYGSNGSGAALKYTVSTYNPVSLGHWGVYMDMQESAAGSLATITPFYTKVKSVNGNAYGYYADASIHTGGTGSAYAFYGLNGLNYFAGNTGIGTANPDTKLHVAGTFKLVDGTQGAGKVLTSDANGMASWQTAGGGGGLWTDGGSGNLYNTTQTGSIAIGLAAAPAGYKLAVAGNIIVEKVKTRLQASGWPDYVFNTGYSLPSLKDVELYIRANSHLPGVPSAKEIGENGLDLGDNQAVLLKKIEELTLYMIDMNKKMEKLTAENEAIKKQLAEKQ